MDQTAPKPPASGYAFIAFFVALFLFFTPFEYGEAHSTMPKYLAVALSTMLLGPLLLIQRMRLREPSVIVFAILATILVHTTVINPVPGQFILLIVCNLVLAVLMYEASFIWRRQFVAAATWLLFLNAFFITIQSLLFYVFSYGIFDFHKLIFGSSSRFAEDFLNIARFSGLHVEPGTYANYIACLTAVLILAADFTKRTMWISFVGVISIFLTNSGSSAYFVPVLTALLAYLWRKDIRLVHIVVLLLGIVAYLHFSGVITHYETRFMERDDGSLSHRLEGVHAYLSLSFEGKFIGIGFDRDPCVRCFYQDIGVTFNLLTRGGALVAIALAVLLARMVSVNGVVLSAILFLIPLNEKMFFYEAPIWLFLLFALTGCANSVAPGRRPLNPFAPAGRKIEA
jgi:hypothetical protein